MRISLTNQDRAKRAETVLELHSNLIDPGVDDFDDTSVGDLLTDLMHLCEQRNLQFEHALDLARMHFEAEVAEEQEQAA